MSEVRCLNSYFRQRADPSCDLVGKVATFQSVVALFETQVPEAIENYLSTSSGMARATVERYGNFFQRRCAGEKLLQQI